ncbi:uncharacterized protein LOC141905985 [Tubulanus polymorphus]|uniref:uncharacterized protein LOC141905985 n=1 Tax=Tubulanus polymorphus TaxID=672921 RepID=UPI003DA6569B
MASSEEKQSFEDLKQKGNDCVKAGNHAEAVLHYTHAIKLEPNNHLLYSNRSLAFLKVGQIYYAREDALETIRLQPQWAKGYFRKGESEFQAQNFQDALFTYRHALILEPQDKNIWQAIRKTDSELTKQNKIEKRLPYYGVCLGLLFGASIVLSDSFLTKQPAIQYLFLKCLLVAVFGGIGLGLSVAYRYYIKEQRKSLLQPPLDLLAELNGDKNNEGSNTVGNRNKRSTTRGGGEESGGKEEKHPKRKGGASAGRLRFKKGKS